MARDGRKTLREPRQTACTRRTDPTFQNRHEPAKATADGSVAEWFKALVLKTSVRGTVPWVRIPPLPPLALAKAFSRSSYGRIFPLFPGVVLVGLSTAPVSKMPRSCLSGPTFSGPHDCADLVKFLQVSDKVMLLWAVG